MCGANYECLYQGFKNFVDANDVIVVVPNYRTGVFGYMQADASDTNSANLFMVDLWQALLWVEHNIENFGGDRQKVTLAGQGSGAMATHLQCEARGLM